ncbi:MAG: nitroreductase family protein [Clostridia bacterium]|nr:nitroreductase family protein [Clostridia bacterium]
MENSVIKTMLERSSIRAYSDEKLTYAELHALEEAALSSPTAMNRQDQRFIFVTNDAMLQRLEQAIMQSIIDSGNTDFAERIKSRGGKTTYNARLIVIIVNKPSHFSRVDAGIAVENLALAAKSLGLDSVILGMPEGAFAGEYGAALREEFRFPEGFEFSIAIGIGHRATEKIQHEWNREHVIYID